MATFKIRATVEVDEDKFRELFEYADVGPGGIAGWLAFEVDGAIRHHSYWSEAVLDVHAEAMEVIQ